uniref:Ferritin n=1 Tax=Bombus ignitus TaxID=130704 RepID=A8D916_BOMIG|nr:ferritin [Bombus ignitus]
MKLIYIFLVTFLCINGSLGNKLQCTSRSVFDIPKNWTQMANSCTNELKAQVNTEINAAMTYLAMGAHFARDTVNRPGFSKFFFDSASEEREHAIKIIEYLLMRGHLTDDVSKLLDISSLGPLRETWSNGIGALKNALELETDVTKKIRNIIKHCEKPKDSNFNDYHLVDYLTGEFLTEQYKGQRDLAGKISTLGKMMATNGVLGEFLFDKKLLNNEV